MALRTGYTRERAGMESRLRVAACTVLRRAFVDIIGVALRTGQTGMLAGQLENRKIMIKRGWPPTVGCMALVTLLSISASVRIINGVTSFAILRCALEYALEMTLAANNTQMRASQFENGIIMIEGRWLPDAGCMAGRAIYTQAALMGVIFCVTGNTIRGCALKHTRLVMTFRANHIDMCAS